MRAQEHQILPWVLVFWWGQGEVVEWQTPPPPPGQFYGGIWSEVLPRPCGQSRACF